MAEVIAKSRFVRSAPRKLRAVAKLIKNKNAGQSLIVLRHTPQKAAGILANTIKSAIANAANNFNLDKDLLIIKSIRVDGGPTLKRFRAMARGSGNAYKKRTSHITVILYTAGAPLPKTQPVPELSDTKTSVKRKTATRKSTEKTSEKPKGSKTTVSVKSRKAKK